jgi:HEAT repeat protein
MRPLLSVFIVVLGLHSAVADDQRTFCGKSLARWRELLRDKTASESSRRQAAFALGCFGPEAKPAVPDLIDAVRQGQVRDEAADAMTWIASGTDTAVPVLIERFLKRGCQHLTGAGTYFFDDSMENALVRIGGPAVPALIEILSGPNREMRVCAAFALGRIGPAARAAGPALLRAIEQSDAQRESQILVHYAVRALGRIGPESKAAVPALNRLLEQRNPDSLSSHFDIVTALSRIGAPPVQKVLDAFLRDADPYEASQLAWLGPLAQEATPSLRALLNDKRPQARISAAVALAHIDRSATESIAVLTEGLKRRDDETLDVDSVPEALARFGPIAKSAIPTLLDLVKSHGDDPDLYIALVQIDPEGKDCVPALISALKHEDYHVVDIAATCLALLGERAKDAVPALAAAVTSHSEETFYNGVDPQESAAKALMRIGPPAKSAIPTLIEALKYVRIVRGDDCTADQEISGAAAAAKVLGSFGRDAKAAIPALIESARFRENNGDNWLVRRAAILALGRIGPDAKTAIPILRKMIEDDREYSVCVAEAIAALYQLAPDGRQVAEKWLERSAEHQVNRRIQTIGLLRFGEVRGRALVMGVMGRTSVEGDCLTRWALEWLHRILDVTDQRQEELMMDFGDLFEDLGVGGRLAIPDLNELRKHANPWVRMWATQALDRIIPRDRLPLKSGSSR